jgi:hypothetical protein
MVYRAFNDSKMQLADRPISLLLSPTADRLGICSIVLL